MSSADPFSSRFEVFGREPNNFLGEINRPAFEQLKRLLDLDEGGDGRVILLRAPRAGYGKTSLLQRLASEFSDSHHFVRVNLAGGRTTDAAHVLEYVLQALCRVLPDSNTLTHLDLLARKVLALGLEPLVASGEVPCQDREGALQALKEQPIETFDFHHDRAVTAHWTKSNFEILGPRLAAELTRVSGASLREASYWVELLFRFATTAPDNVERARLLFETVFRSDLPNQSESAAEERLHGLLSMLGTVTRLVMIVDDTEGLSTHPPDALQLASFLTNISQSCPGSLVLLSVNNDVWETAFLPLLPHGLADRLAEYIVALDPLSKKEARDLVKSRAGDRADEVLDKIDWGDDDLYARHVLKCASEAWDALEHAPVDKTKEKAKAQGAEASTKKSRKGKKAGANRPKTLRALSALDDELDDDLDDDDLVGDLLDDSPAETKPAAAAAHVFKAAAAATSPVGTAVAPAKSNTEQDKKSQEPEGAKEEQEPAKSQPAAQADLKDKEKAAAEEKAPAKSEVENEEPAAYGEKESGKFDPAASPFQAKDKQAESEDQPAATPSESEKKTADSEPATAAAVSSQQDKAENPFSAEAAEEVTSPFAARASEKKDEPASSPFAETSGAPKGFGSAPAEPATADQTSEVQSEQADSPFSVKQPTPPTEESEQSTSSPFSAKAPAAASPFASRVEPKSEDGAQPTTKTQPASEENTEWPEAAQDDKIAKDDTEAVVEKKTEGAPADEKKPDSESKPVGDAEPSPFTAKQPDQSTSTKEESPFAAEPQSDAGQDHPFQAAPARPEPADSDKKMSAGVDDEREALAPAAQKPDQPSTPPPFAPKQEGGGPASGPPPLSQSAPASFSPSGPPPSFGPPPVPPSATDAPTDDAEEKPADGPPAFVPVGQKQPAPISEDAPANPASPFASLGGESAEKDLSEVSSIFAPIKPEQGKSPSGPGGTLDPDKLKPLLEQADQQTAFSSPPSSQQSGGPAHPFQAAPQQTKSSPPPLEGAADSSASSVFKPLSSPTQGTPQKAQEDSGFHAFGQTPQPEQPSNLSGASSSPVPPTPSPLRPVGEAPAFGGQPIERTLGPSGPSESKDPSGEQASATSTDEDVPAAFRAKPQGSDGPAQPVGETAENEPSPFTAKAPDSRDEAPTAKSPGEPTSGPDDQIASPFKPVKLQPVAPSDSPFAAKNGPQGAEAADQPQRTELPPKKVEIPPPASTSTPFEPGSPPAADKPVTPPSSPQPFEPASDPSPFSAVGQSSGDQPSPPPAAKSPLESGDTDQDKVDELLRQFKERYGRK